MVSFLAMGLNNGDMIALGVDDEGPTAGVIIRTAPDIHATMNIWDKLQ